MIKITGNLSFYLFYEIYRLKIDLKISIYYQKLQIDNLIEF